MINMWRVGVKSEKFLKWKIRKLLRHDSAENQGLIADSGAILSIANCLMERFLFPSEICWHFAPLRGFPLNNGITIVVGA